MKTEITTDRIETEDAASTDAEPAVARKQSLNLKVRARVGVETRTQLQAGSGCNMTLGTDVGTRGS